MAQVRITGTASFSCRGARGRFERRTVDVDFEIAESADPNDYLREAANVASAQIGEQCYHPAWVSFAVSPVEAPPPPDGGALQLIGIRVLAHYICTDEDGNETDKPLEFPENYSADTTQEELLARVYAWAQSIEQDIAAGFGPQIGDFTGCQLAAIEIIAPAYWAISVGI